jgi:threonyl-tRNA synthetase
LRCLSEQVVVRDSLERSWQCSTIQCDFNMAARFGLTYSGEHAAEGGGATGTAAPVMIHRAIFGSLERFVGLVSVER